MVRPLWVTGKTPGNRTRGCPSPCRPQSGAVVALFLMKIPPRNGETLRSPRCLMLRPSRRTAPMGCSMNTDASEETLRETAFGRRSSPAQAQAAMDELWRRAAHDVSDTAERTSGEIQGRDEKPTPAPKNVVQAAEQRMHDGHLRPAVIAIIAFGLGVWWTAVYLALSDDRSIEGAAFGTKTTSQGTVVTNRDGSRELFEVPALEESVDGAEVDRWFGVRQTERDALPVEMNTLNVSESRLVRQVGTDGTVWIARAVDGSYCAIIDSNTAGSGASCTTPAAFAEKGVLARSEKHSVFWNPETLIISMAGP